MTACKVEGCEKPKHGLGLCKAHYNAERRSNPGSGCTVRDCSSSHYAKGYCYRHYCRWRKHGDPLTVVLPSQRRKPPSRPAADRFWPKVNKLGPTPDHRPQLGPCWEWQGYVGPSGYGHFAVVARRGEEVYADAHRVAYALTVGPIPDGLVVDHLCVNRICVNPEHLEAVTQAENLRRILRVLA